VFVLNADAQYFRWKSPVEKSDTSGYVRVLLQPEVTGEMRNDYPDVRLYDESDMEIPYIIGKDQIVQGTTRFVEYPVVGKRDIPNNSWITIENPLYKTENLDHLCLEVNNTEVSRRMVLSGSYDNSEWFAIKDRFTSSFYESFEQGASKTTNIVRFDFPLSNYRYYKFTFDEWYHWWDDYELPVFIVRAGCLVDVNPASVPNQRMEIPGVNYTTKQFGKTTCVDITFDTPQYLDYIRFDLTSPIAPGTFHRGARLYEIDSTHWCDTITEEYVSATIVSQGSLNEFNLYGHRVKHLCLHIDNEDDQPLRINKVIPIQIRHYLVAYLEKGKSYYIKYGNDSVAFPRYDVRYKADMLAVSRLSIVGTGKREALYVPGSPPESPHSKSTAPQNPAPEVEGTSFMENKAAIWASIVVVVLVLGWMSVRMLREMENKKE
jgi:hypothetical protein